MKHEFRKIETQEETRYVLEDATAGATSAGAIAAVDMPLGELQKREPAKPRNFVAKNAKMGGAGQHKDKKKAEKQGDVKHKKPFAEGVGDLGYNAQSLIMKLRRDVEEKRLQPTAQAVLAAARELAGDMDFAPQLLVKQVLGQGVAEGSHEDQVSRLAAYNEKMADENPPIELGLREVGNWAKVGHYGNPIKTAWLNIAKYGVRNNRFKDSVDQVMSAIGEFPDLEDEVYDMYDINQDEVDILYNAYETVYDQWEQSQGVAEGTLDEAVGGNYLYHATGGLKKILSTGRIFPAHGPQDATKAQTTLPTVSTTRDWNYASGGESETEGVDSNAVIVLDRNAVESNFKTLGTSQSRDVRGLAHPQQTNLDAVKTARSYDVDNNKVLNKKDADELFAKGSILGRDGKPVSREVVGRTAGAAKQGFYSSKAGGEFEEAIVVPETGLPIARTMFGFWVNPQSQLTKDPEVMNDPRRLELAPGGTGRFVKAQQTQGVAEDHEIQMAGSELQSIAKDALQLLQLIKQYSEMDGLDAWQQSKITKAADYLNAVHQSISGKQGVDEAWQNDESNLWYIYDDAAGKLKQKMIQNLDEPKARSMGYRDSIEGALKVAGIIRSKFDPKKFVQNIGGKWVPVSPFGGPDTSEETYMESLENMLENILGEKIPKGADVNYYIQDFSKSSAPQFRGKTKEKRKQMAVAAYYGSKQPKKKK